MKIKVIDQKGKAAGEVEVSEIVFGAERNEALIHEVAIAQANNARQGTKSTLARGEVRGHAAKPHRQKGTGRARQGSTKAPHFTGGGVAFAPKPRDFSTKINKKKKEAAFKSAISAKLADSELIIINNLKLKEAKTKFVADILGNLKMEDKRVIFVTAGKDDEFLRSVNNIQKVDVNTAAQLCVHDIVNYKFVIATQDAVTEISKNYSETGEAKTNLGGKAS